MPNSAVIIAAAIKKTKLCFTVIVRTVIVRLSSSFFAGRRCSEPVAKGQKSRTARRKRTSNDMMTVTARLWQIYEKAGRAASSAAL
jgi:hypothetical protein